VVLNIKEFTLFIAVYMGKSENLADRIMYHLRTKAIGPWRVVSEDEIFDVSLVRGETRCFEISEVKVAECYSE
jgi:hypothetical protein